LILNLELSKEEVIKFIVNIKNKAEIHRYFLEKEPFIFVSPAMFSITTLSKEVIELLKIKDEDSSFVLKYIEIQKHRITFVSSNSTLREFQFKSDINSDDFEKLLLGLDFKT